MTDDPEPQDKWSNEWTEWRVRQMQAAAAARDEALVNELCEVAAPAFPAISRALEISAEVGERDPSPADAAAFSANLHGIVHAITRGEPGAHLKVISDDDGGA